jgi:pyruvate dehydrogenase E2 component (dihydrolipoamide acetyltransferase)
VVVDVVLPQAGLEVSEGTVIALHVGVGDRVAKGDPLVEVETDKAVSDVEAPQDGVVVGLEVEVGDTVPVGATLIRLGEAAEDGGRARAGAEPESAAADPAPGAAEPASTAPTAVADPPRLRAAPIARRAALHHGIALEEISGTGPRGRITLRDVERVVLERGEAPGDADADVAAPEPERIEPLSPTRLSIARRMTESQAIPQFTLTRDVDVGRLLAEKERLSAEGPVKLGVLDLLVQALAETVVRHPDLGASFVAATDDRPAALRRRDGVDVGLAVATDRGLLVPVIRRAHERSLADLARERARLVETARAGRLQLAEMTAATVTLSSLGTFGVDRFTAMLNPGESAILAAGRTVERVVPRDRGLAVVPTMALTFTFDHRAVDGAAGARALAELAGLVEGGMEWRT